MYEKSWSLDIFLCQSHSSSSHPENAIRGGYGSAARRGRYRVREIPDPRLVFQEEITVVVRVRVESKMVTNDQNPSVWCQFSNPAARGPSFSSCFDTLEVLQLVVRVEGCQQGSNLGGGEGHIARRIYNRVERAASIEDGDKTSIGVSCFCFSLRSGRCGERGLPK